MNQQQTEFDSILKSVMPNIEEAIGGFLGTSLSLNHVVNKFISKTDLLSNISQKMVVAKLSIAENSQENLFFLAPLKTAIFWGGTMVMLPQADLESKLANEECEEEDLEAFGEIAKIVADIYSSAFADFFTERPTLQMDSIENIEPSQDNLGSFFSSEEYSFSSIAIAMGDQQLDELWMLIPPSLLPTEDNANLSAPPTEDEKQPSTTPSLVFIITANEVDVEPFTKALHELDMPFQVANCKDNLKDALPAEGIIGVFLTIGKVDEQALGIIIKARSVCGEMVPLIAAGCEWTKDAVIKTVECGVNDIILTPVTTEEIKKKIQSYFTS